MNKKCRDDSPYKCIINVSVNKYPNIKYLHNMNIIKLQAILLRHKNAMTFDQ